MGQRVVTLLTRNRICSREALGVQTACTRVCPCMPPGLRHPLATATFARTQSLSGCLGFKKVLEPSSSETPGLCVLPLSPWGARNRAKEGLRQVTPMLGQQRSAWLLHGCCMVAAWQTGMDGLTGRSFGFNRNWNHSNNCTLS